jgi:cyclic dehypoxanthinyl futalosine synthase
MLEVEDGLEEIYEKALSGVPLSPKEGVALFNSDLVTLGFLSNAIREKLCGDLVTFVIDSNINYTTVCVSGCKFCAFYRPKSSPEAYTLSIDEIMEKIRRAVSLGATQILLQGGLNPDIPIEYYEEMLRATRERFPQVQRHFFSPSEISFIAEISGNSIRETLERLIAAGLQSIPGGGAEILDDEIRKKVSPNKISWKRWKEVMVTAHGLGLPTTATMVFGLGESTESRVRHLLRIREIQEKTGGFTAFIPWSFQPQNTRLAREMGVSMDSTGVDYLKVVAVSRVLLNNIRNIQASWVTQGTGVAQLALFYGANDFGGTMIEENVVRAAGVETRYLPPEKIVKYIREVGRPAAQRDTLYNVLKKY